ncbi:hypothetical protein A5N81_32935 [Pseudomonas aeruginosa]|nr:hypothetical protein A5N81_32935 [Pseudomonas aeruginosa]
MTPTTGKSKFRTLRPWLITALAFAAVIGLVMWLAAKARAVISHGRRVRNLDLPVVGVMVLLQA